MPAHHFLPATFLAGFSADNTIPRRKRRLAQGDKQSGNCITALAERLAVIRDLYTLRDPGSDHHPQIIDNAWAAYEAKLAPCIKKLTQGTIDAVEWAGVLVPFIACLFARGPDFQRRMEARIEARGASALAKTMPVDNLNYIRGMEIQRLLGPILCAKWIISRTPEKGKLITTDLGFAVFQDPDGQIGIAIPIDGQHIVQLIPRRYGDVAIAGEDKWYPILEHRLLLSGNYAQLNQAIASQAQRFLFGKDEDLVKSYLSGTTRDILTLEPGDVGFLTGPLAAVHEFTWHRFISAISNHPKDEEAHKLDINWAAVSSAWKPPVVFFPTNLPEFPSPLHRHGNILGIEFYDVEGFPSTAHKPEPILVPDPHRDL
jgi:hypothetical protein